MDSTTLWMCQLLETYKPIFVSKQFGLHTDVIAYIYDGLYAVILSPVV